MKSRQKSRATGHDASSLRYHFTVSKAAINVSSMLTLTVLYEPHGDAERTRQMTFPPFSIQFMDDGQTKHKRQYSTIATPR